MKTNRNTLIIAGGVSLIVLAVALFFAFYPASTEQPQRRDQPVPQTAEKPPRPAVQQATVVPLQLQQNGLYTVEYKPFAPETLTARYPFMTEMLAPQQDSWGDSLPNMQGGTNVSEITIPSKQLTLLVLYYDDPAYCTGVYCQLSLYVKRPQGFESYLSLMATKSSYVMVDDKSVSLITCERPSGYRRWRLGDGTLDGPIPPDSPGHFVPVGIFKHDKVAPCPG